MRDINNFKEYFGGRFWAKLKESVVEFDDCIGGKVPFLDDVYSEIKTKKYQPDLVREYIISNKHNRVTRIVPTFTRKDYCVYFYCIKSLEKFMCPNRIDGTFGGWTLSNGLKRQEDAEIVLQEDCLISDIFSSSDISYNPLAWKKYWKEFQTQAYFHYQDEKYNFFLKFDIANFYDCININILENKIRLSIQENDQKELDEDGKIVNYNDDIELLGYFLKFWNRKFEGYKAKNVGIPQEEVGDCSRILANFYLQEYDSIMFELCQEKGAKYLRYADDQMFFTDNEKTARYLLFEASKELHKIGLNINSSKVDEFKTRSEFEIYWSFDIFQILSEENKENKVEIEKAVNIYLKRSNSEKRIKSEMVLNRLLSFRLDLIEPSLRYNIKSKLFDKEYLSTGNFWIFQRIYKILSEKEKDDFFTVLDELINDVNFNSFHYNLMKFYKKVRRDFDLNILKQRINVLKI